MRVGTDLKTLNAIREVIDKKDESLNQTSLL